MDGARASDLYRAVIASWTYDGVVHYVCVCDRKYIHGPGMERDDE